MKKIIEKGLKVFDNLKDNVNSKMIMFFCFYLVFFVVLILIVRYSPKKNASPEQYEGSRPTFFTFSVLDNNNYHFKFTINLDEYKYEYEGDKYNELESFKYNNSDYFNNNNTFYKYDSSWTKIDNPYRFSEFLNGKNIKNLINASYYENSVMEENNYAHHEMSLSSDTINKLLKNKDTDIDEIPNKIVVYADKDGEIYKINYNLDSYCKVIDGCQNTLNITLEYSNSGKIQDIKNPIN